MAAGIPSERRFYRIELLRADKIPDHADFLNRYLHRQRVGLTETRLAAEGLRDDARQKERARNTISSVWRNLLATPDDALCRLLAEAVAGDCGTEPDPDDVDEFFRSMLTHSGQPDQAVPQAQDSTSPLPQVSRTTPAPTGVRRASITGFILDGQTRAASNGIRTLVELIKEFDRRDPGFMERFASRTIGRTRRLVARNQEELYEQVHLREYAENLGNDGGLVLT